MNIRTVIIIILILAVFSCRKQPEIPKELSYSFEYLDNNWDPEAIEVFKNITEKDETASIYHFGIGMHLRNRLLNNNVRSDSIVKFFNRLGIDHFDHMSGIILATYHRHLNGIELDLDGLVNEIITSEKPLKECEKQVRKRAKNIYTQFNVLDSILIKMPVDNGSVFGYYCPRDWNFRSNIDLSIEGIITEKFIIDSIPFYDHLIYNFKVKILKLNNERIEYFMEEIKIGDRIDLTLEDSFKIE